MANTLSQAGRERFPLDALVLDEAAGEPLYLQLENQIKSAIWDKRLRSGDRLPSTRQLAKDLGIARNTAKSAYNQLVVEGYLVSDAGSGTRVAEELPEQLLHVPPREAAPAAGSCSFPLSAAARRVLNVRPWIESESSRPSRPFRAHTPASDVFPRALWARITTRRARRMARGLLERLDPRGYEPLREAVAGYLGTARGVACDPGQVVITAGTQQAFELIAKLLLEPGDRVCMEDPGYTPARILFEMAGAEIVSIPVDDEGLDVAKLDKTVPEAKLVYVTPSSQFPLGVTMSLSRRLALIEWSKRSGALILEDDYNGEYRYSGRPLPALFGLSPPGRVLYAGSFSKLLFPALRLGYIVVPPDSVDHFAAARWLIDRHSPPLEQAVLADFIIEGHFVRHIRRMRTLYAERQGVLVEAASRDLGGVLHVPPCDAGLHLIGWLDKAIPEEALLRAASSAGIELAPTSWFGAGNLDRQSVILGYAPFTAKEIRSATEAFARACQRLL